MEPVCNMADTWSDMYNTQKWYIELTNSKLKRAKWNAVKWYNSMTSTIYSHLVTHQVSLFNFLKNGDLEKNFKTPHRDIHAMIEHKKLYYIL